MGLGSEGWVRFRVLGLWVQGLGYRVQGSEFRVQVQGSGFRVQGSGFRVQGSGFRAQGSGFRVQGSGLRVRAVRVGVPVRGALWRATLARTKEIFQPHCSNHAGSDFGPRILGSFPKGLALPMTAALCQTALSRIRHAPSITGVPRS